MKCLPKLFSFLALVGSLALGGCSYGRFSDGKGVTWQHLDLFVSPKIGSASIPTANGPASLTGYAAKQTESVAEIVTSVKTP